MRKARPLYAAYTESFREKISDDPDEAQPVPSMLLRQPIPGVSQRTQQNVVARTTSPGGGGGASSVNSSPTVVARSSHRPQSDHQVLPRTPLRRDHLSSRALGLGEAIPVRRTSPSASHRAAPQHATPSRTGLSATPRGGTNRREGISQPFSSTEVSESAAAAAADGSDSLVKVVITSRGNENSGMVRDPVDHCIFFAPRSERPVSPNSESADAEKTFVGSGQQIFHCDDSFLGEAERLEMGVKCADPLARNVTFQGNHGVVFAAGPPGSGKTQSLFSKNGIAPSYLLTLLQELDRTFLSKLWSVHVAVVNIVGGQVFDALPKTLHARRSAAVDPEEGIDLAIHFDASCARSDDAMSTCRSTSHNTLGGGGHSASNKRNVSDPTKLFEKLSVVISTPDDVADLFEEICNRGRERSRVTWQEIVYISVVPSLGVQQTFSGLMRSVGAMCFVELGAGMSNDEEIKVSNRASNAQRHTVTTVMNVLCALTRQALRNSSSMVVGQNTTNNSNANGQYNIHVPYGDTMLTLLLEPFLANGGKATVLAHIHAAEEERVASLSILHVVDQVLRHRFPNGKPQIDYRAQAKIQWLRADKLQREIDAAKHAWDAERQQLESDRWMLRKAYDELQQSTTLTVQKEVTSASHSMRQEIDSERQQLQSKFEQVTQVVASLKAMLSTTQKEKYMLEEQQSELLDKCSKLENENVKLKEQVVLRRASSLGSSSNYPIGVNSSTDRAGKETNGTDPSGNDNELAPQRAHVSSSLKEILGALSKAEIIRIPQPRAPNTYITEAEDHDSLLVMASAAVLQLVHQICERERMLDLLLRKAVDDTEVEEPGMQASPSSAAKGSKSRLLYGVSAAVSSSSLHNSSDNPKTTPAEKLQRQKKNQKAIKELEEAPLLKWQTWRALMDRLHHVSHSLQELPLTNTLLPNFIVQQSHFSGALPKSRTKNGMSLFRFAATSMPSLFSKFWLSGDVLTAPREGSLSSSTANANTGMSSSPVKHMMSMPVAEVSYTARNAQERRSHSPPLRNDTDPFSNAIRSQTTSRDTSAIIHEPQDDGDMETSAIERLARQLSLTVDGARSMPQVLVTQPSSTSTLRAPQDLRLDIDSAAASIGGGHLFPDAGMLLEVEGYESSNPSD